LHFSGNLKNPSLGDRADRLHRGLPEGKSDDTSFLPVLPIPILAAANAVTPFRYRINGDDI
jgi:hypothetical protein